MGGVFVKGKMTVRAPAVIETFSGNFPGKQVKYAKVILFDAGELAGIL